MMMEPGESDTQSRKKQNHTYKQSFLRGAVYLSLAALIVKVLSAVYKVPYQNITGDTGFYVYQQVYPFYGIALVMATYGFPVIISKLVADEFEQNGRGAVRSILAVSFVTVGIVNFVLGGLLIALAPYLAGWMGDPGLVMPLRGMAAPFFIMPFVSVLRGYYQGLHWMTPSAVSQVGEQFVRVAVILVLSAWAMSNYGPYEAGTAAAAGSFFGAGAAFLILLAAGKKYTKNSFSTHNGNGTHIKWKEQSIAILTGGFFVCLSAMSLIAMQLIDSFTLIRLLRFSGFTLEAAGILKGVYDRGWPVVQLGTVLTTSFSLSLVPMVAKAALRHDRKLQQQYTIRALKTGAVFGGAAAVGLASVMPSLNPMLFTDTSGQTALQVISFSVLPASVFLTGAAILHGAGKGRSLLGLTAAGLFLKAAGNAVFVPAFAINGAALATLISFSVMAVMLGAVLYRYELLVFSEKRAGRTVRWAAALLLTGITAFLWQSGTIAVLHAWTEAGSRTAMTAAALSASSAGAVVFLAAAVKLGVVTKEEWGALPKLGSVLEKFERKKGADRQ
ncbi:putative polysaccharide biosynthesis protein [Alteribacter lacisalsi]|nr:polysaccharide biosynthesis protein [Alteribacter lacisalsi]